MLYRGYDSIYDISTAEDSEQALEVLALDIPDLIVSDVMLPGTNAGYTLLKKHKQNRADLFGSVYVSYN